MLAATRGVAGRTLWIGAGIVAGALVMAALADQIGHLLVGAGRQILNAVILAIAVAMVGWTVVWMSMHGRQMAVSQPYRLSGIPSSHKILKPLVLQQFIICGPDTVTVDYRAADAANSNRCKCDAQGNCTSCTCPTPEDPWGSVVVRISYGNPLIQGKSIFQCHIGEHEDAGMMQLIEMSRDAGRCEPGTPSSTKRLVMTPMARAVCTPKPATHKH